MGDAKEVWEAIDRLSERGPSKLILDVDDFKRAHRRWMLQTCRGFIVYFEGALTATNTAILGLNYVDKSHWPEHRALQFWFMPGCIQTLVRSFDDILDGFYAEALTILRSVYEAALRIAFISCYPADCWATLVPPSKGQRQFIVTNFPRDELHIDWTSLYRTHSIFAHSKQFDVLTRAAEATQGKVRPCAFELKCDEEAASMPMNSATFLLWLVIRLMRALFLDDSILPLLDQDLIESLRDADRVLRGACEAHPKTKTYHRAVPEADKLIRIVAAAEAGMDWRLVVQGRL